MAIPSFTAITQARASAAANAVATIAKECAVKYANGVQTHVSCAPDGYKTVTAGGTSTGCTEDGDIIAESLDTKRYIFHRHGDGAKTCEPKSIQGCSSAVLGDLIFMRINIIKYFYDVKFFL